MPQPMSTPTAAGMIAPLVGITLPTVAPIPQWTSGIAAIHLKMKGSCAAFRSCLRAASSRGTPFVQAFTGTPLSGAITLYVVSDILLSSHSVAYSVELCWWPRWDSNPDSTDFEPVASASWTTGPFWWVSPDSNRDAPMEHSALQAGAANRIRLTPEPSYLRTWRRAWESNPVARERLAR